MKTKIVFFVICNLMICNLQFSQNITNTLGTNGVFTIKDVSTNYFILNQFTGEVNITKNLRLENTNGSYIGVIYKGVDRFIHNTGILNTFIGVNSGNFNMTGSENTAVGVGSLYSITTGSYNIAVGTASLSSNTSGNFNTALGSYTLQLNATGYGNTAIGTLALLFNTTGYNNTAVGQYSLYQNSSGYQNTALGYFSLKANTTGYNNTAIGDSSLRNNSTGFRNTALGFQSGSGITTGSNNIIIGDIAQVPSGTSNDQVRIGNTLITYAGIQVPWTTTSDRRLKSDILNSGLGLGFISKLRPVSYFRNNDKSKKTEYGFIAQEVEEVLNETGTENTGMITITDEGIYELRYNDLLAPMVKAIQELSEGLLAEKTEKDNEIAQLKSEYDELKISNEKLATEVESLSLMGQKLAKLEQMINELTIVRNTSLTENK